MAYGLQSYGDGTKREDLLDIIGDVSPDSNPLSTMLKVTSASQRTHEWLEDYQARPTANTGSVEGAETTYDDITPPARRTNVTQIVTESVRVSDTQRAIDHAGVGDPFTYQKGRALLRWKNRQEFALVRSALSSGASGSSQTMIGIEAVVTSHTTNRLSGTSLSETELNAMFYDVAGDVGNEDVFDIVLTTLQLRQKISTFTAGSTKYVNASDKRLTRPIQVYESDFGVHRIFGHKDVSVSAATPGPRVLGIREDKWRIAYLRRPKFELLAKVGDRENGHIVGEVTLEYLAERANAQRTGFAYAG